MKRCEKWFVGARCPYCEKTVSVSPEKVTVFGDERTGYTDLWVECPRCGEQFGLSGFARER